MKWIQIKALFESEDICLGEEMVSDIFFTLGLKGVVCQVPLDAPPEGFGSDALPIPDENWVSGYIPDTETSIDILETIRKRAEALADLDIRVVIKTEIVDQEEWAESWKRFFHVSRITERVVIKPAWREFKPEPDDIVIEIDPGMAFGTGTHPTTSMCIALIEKYLENGNSFLDVGTGSGILMITAAKFGASLLVGLDTDEVAVQVATENLIKNAVPSNLFNVETKTLESYLAIGGASPSPDNLTDELALNVGKQEKKRDKIEFDLVAANIIAEVLIEIMPDIQECIKTDGTIILSGIIKEREAAITRCLDHHSFALLEVRSDGEWLAIAAKKKRLAAH